MPSTFDPLENLKASVEYAIDRYGMVPGRLRAGEYILTPDEASRISREILGRWAEPEEDVFDSYPEPPPPPVF